MTLQLTPRLSSRPVRYPNRLREYRLRCGLSQKALAALLRKNRKLVSSWEVGFHFPAGRALFQLARALNTLVEGLYEPMRREQSTFDKENAE
jgi:transcriptional regulator with XRE-family HTH domain